LMADTVPDWQTLANIMDGFYGRNPYTMDYQWWGAKGAPDVKPWPGPGRKQIGGNGVYDAEFTGTHYDGIPMAELTVDDMVGDDILGMVTTWEMRPGIYWHDSDPGPNGKFEEIGDPDYDDGEKHGLTAEDIVFGLNLIRDQECDRYQTQWWFIYAVEKINDYKFAVYEERQYVFAFQDHGVGCYVPKHIWEGYINPTYDIGSLPITRLDGTTGYGDEIIGWEHHHEEWAPWEEVHIQDPSIRDPVTGAISDDPRFRLTKLIGFGPFKYHIDGWIVGDSSHFEGNRQYFGHCVCDGDVDFDQITMLPDMNKVMRSVGEYRLDPNYDVAADICYPAQVIDVSEIYAVQSHWAHYWGPAPLRSGFTWCDCHTGE
jgi:ABC-type transport system substrate-binding protein